MPFLDSSVSSPLQRLVLLKNVSIVVKVKLKKKTKKKLKKRGKVKASQMPIPPALFLCVPWWSEPEYVIECAAAIQHQPLLADVKCICHSAQKIHQKKVNLRVHISGGGEETSVIIWRHNLIQARVKRLHTVQTVAVAPLL